MTILILGEPEDPSVHFCALGLRDRSHDVVVVAASDLFEGSTLSYRHDDHGVSSTLTLASGRDLTHHDVTLVINRASLSIHGGPGAHERYVDEEWRAALVAWLRTMSCPQLNAPRGATLSGLIMNDGAWRVAAAAAGLPTAPWPSATLPSDVVVLAVGDQVVDHQGLVSSPLCDGVVRLATALGLGLLECAFHHGASGWQFHSAEAVPDLSAYGDPALDLCGRLAARVLL